MDQALKLARYQLRNYLRSRRYILMLAIVAAVGAIVTAVVGYYHASVISDPLSFYATFWANGITVLIILAGIIFGGDAIAGEFQNKTGYFLMGIPVRRATIYVGKFLAAFAAALTAVVFYLVILLGNGIYYFGGNAFPWELGASFLLAITFLLALLGTTFLFSSLFKTSLYGTIVVAVLFLFGFTLLQALVQDLVKLEPSFIISYASGVIGDIFSHPYPAHATTGLGGMGPGGGLTVYNPTVPEGVGIMLAYFFGTTILGLLLFEREEFT